MVYVDQIALEKLSMIVSTLRAFISRVELEPGKAGYQAKGSINASRTQGVEGLQVPKRNVHRARALTGNQATDGARR
jgi:hypothetical protein